MKSKVEKNLIEAFSEIADKGEDKVSVSLLCEKADVSRASFYLYYKDIEDFSDKCLIYVVEKIYEQLMVIMDVARNTSADKQKIVLSEEDIRLLKAYTGKDVYWDFAKTANGIIWKRFSKLMIERWGEEYYNENKMVFEFLLNGGIATLYFDLIDFNKQKYLKNMDRITAIVKELLDIQ